MNQIYPYSSPIILNDSIFVQYGGHTGSSVAAQRTAAFLIAEMATTEDLGTFLLPTIVTGTFSYHLNINRILLDYGHVHGVLVTQLLDSEERVYWAQTGTTNVYVDILSDTYGVLNVNYLLANCNCHSHTSQPTQIRVMYRAGLPTGTANNPDVLMAMTIYADLMLQEMIGYGNEAPGDIGVQSFSNQQYSENRVKLLRTTFGTSARAQLAHQLLTKKRKRKWVGLRM